MKKTYIEPKNMVVALKVRNNMLSGSTPYSDNPASGSGTGVTDVTPETGTVGLGRESINTWEEW